MQTRLESTHWKRKLPTVAMLQPDGHWGVLFEAGGLLGEQ